MYLVKVAYHAQRILHSGNRLRRVAVFLHVCLFIILATSFASAQVVNPDPASGLTLDVRAPHNFVVDSNVKTPATYAPQAAYIGVEICNNGDDPLENVVAYIGDYDTGTPGAYPITVIPPGDRLYDGSYAFRHVGGRLGAADAVREIGFLAPGECKIEFWLITYPRMDCEQITNEDWSQCSGGIPVFGASNILSDDLALDFDIWVGGEKSGVPVEAWDTRTVTMRRMISSSANKIWPNTASKVPQEYLDIVDPLLSPLGWSVLHTEGMELMPGDVFTTQGIWYDFGRVTGGFDNDGDLVPDLNGWIQPVGDAAFFDPGCFRVVGMKGILIIKLNDGTEQIIPFEDKTYFQYLPSNNTGVVGLVYYTFMALDAPCESYISPYQLVASGNNNEKFTADYGVLSGAAAPPQPTAPSANLFKSGAPDFVTPQGQGAPPSDGIISWTLDFQNTSQAPIGNPTLNFPVVIRDAIPAGTTYVGGSATSDVDGGAIIRYSTDGGATYSTVQPVVASAVTHIEWRLNVPLPADAWGSASFQVVVPNDYAAMSVPNSATVSIGLGTPIAQATDTVFVSGQRVISGMVFDDNGVGSGGILGDGIRNGTEPGIEDVLVKLYLDFNEDGILDSGDLFMDARLTDADGDYLFENLPAGKFIVVIDPGSFPDGYGPTSPLELTSDLTLADDYEVNFGLLPALTLEKAVVGSANVFSGQEVKFKIDVVNRLLPDSGPPIFSGPTCEYTAWAQVSNNVSKAFSGYLNARYAPDGNEAYGNFGNYRSLQVQTFNFDSQATQENILSVNVVYRARRAGTLVDDSMAFRLMDGTVVRQIDNFTPAQFNAFATTLADYSWDVTSATSWDWAKFASGDYKMEVNTSKYTNADGGLFYVDAVGFRVITDCGDPLAGVYDPHFSVNPATVMDTYDPTELEFLSASVVPTSVDPVSGEIVWEDLGPINPGGFLRILLSFRVKPFDGASKSIVNNAEVTSAWFVDGRKANEPWDDETITAERAGSISGFIWSDTNANGWQPAAAPWGPGYQAGEPFLSGVKVELIQCLEYNNQGGCDAANIFVVDSTLSDGNGYYEFLGLEPGSRYSVRVQTTGYVVPLTQTGDPDDDPNPARGSTGNGGTCGGGGNQEPCNNMWDDGLTTLVIGTDTYGTYSPYTASAWDYTHINFGYSIGTNPSVYGYLWRDINENGVYDPTESPLAGVTVCRDTNANGVCDVGEPTSVTDANGRYQFTGLTAGQSYSIVVNTSTLPAGSHQTGDPDNPNQPCVTCDNRYTTATLVAGTVNGPYNFGYFIGGTSTIGDTVFMDLNGNGIQDGSEGGIENVRMLLYQDYNGNNAFDPGMDILLDEQFTDESGEYLFTNLAAGVYFVVLDISTLPAGYVQTGDPDESGLCVICNSRSSAVPIDGVNSNLNIDFGYMPPTSGSIGDTVWRDINGNGVQGGGAETGIAGITVWLCPGSELVCDGDTAIATEQTNEDGNYLFTDLPDGEYKVSVDTANSNLPTDIFGNIFSPSTATTHTAILSGGNSVLTADFGFVALGALGGFIFYDANRNGNHDYSEQGIAGVTVYLYKESELNSGIFDTLAATTVTADGLGADPVGQYYFTQLMPIPYQIRVETATGPLALMTLSADPDSDGIPCADLTPESDPPNSVCDDAFVYTRLGYGTFFFGANFGYVPPGIIGDFVWLDLDQDGIQGPYETGIADVRVFLDTNGNGVLDWTDLNGNGLWDAGEGERWVYTDFSGEYLFYDLPDGIYTVRVDATTLPPNLAPSYDVDGGILAPGGVATVVISGGQVTSTGNSWCASSDCSLDVDFGYKYDANYVISGTVCLDDDPAYDGVCSGATGEVYLGGHLVYLAMGGAIIGATETEMDGSYLFQGLPTGMYRIALSTSKSPLNIAMLTTELGDTPATAIDVYPASVVQTVEIVDASIYDLDFAFYLDIEFDFGDLPDSYRTTFSRDGARHVIPEGGSTIYLGAIPPDAEPDGQPTPGADGDDSTGIDDEDGVFTVEPWLWTDGTDGGVVNVTVGGSGTGWLVGYIDFNQNGNFLDVGEMVISAAVSLGSAEYTFDIPEGSLGGMQQELYARFRVFTAQPLFPMLAFMGSADDGEVEDYLFRAGPFPPLIAEDDPFGMVNGIAGNPNVGNALDNDTLDGAPVTIDDINIMVLTPAIPAYEGAPTPSLDIETGVVSVPPGTPSDTYTIEYEICEIVSPMNCDSATITVMAIAPSFTVTKTAKYINYPNPNPVPFEYSLIGDVITYEIKVENTGNVGISTVAVEDAQATTGPTYGSGDINTNTILDVGETWIYTATYAITADDLNYGSFTNTASATGRDPNNDLIEDDDSETVIGIDRKVTVRFANPVFDCVDRTYWVDVEFQSKIEDIELYGMNVRFFYDAAVLAFQGFGGFEGGYGQYGMPTILQGNGGLFGFGAVSDYVNGAIRLNNPAAEPIILSTTEWTKLFRVRFDVLAPDNVFCPSIVWDLKKKPAKGGFLTGSNGVVMTAVGARSPSGDAVISALPLNETVEQFNWDYVGDGTPPWGEPVPTICIDTYCPELSVTKTAKYINYPDPNPDPFKYSEIGDVITYEIIVTNTGNVTLYDVDVEDVLTGLGNTIPMLEPDDYETYETTYTISQIDLDFGYFENWATATGYDPNEAPVSDNDDETVDAVQTAFIAVTKAANQEEYSFVGEEITYTITVVNTGNVTVANIVVTDPLTGLDENIGSLAPGASKFVNTIYTIQGADLTEGTVTNTATATGKDPNNVDVYDSDDKTINAVARCIEINAWVFLEGALIDPDNPLIYGDVMRTDLNDLRVLPGQSYGDVFYGAYYGEPGQPYAVPPWNYDGDEGDLYDSFGSEYEGETYIGDAGYPATVVDWVLVSLRDGDDQDGAENPVFQTAALLHQDGHIEFVNAVPCAVGLAGPLYLVVEHRNHLIVMSHEAIEIVDDALQYDFRVQQSYMYEGEGFGVYARQKEVLPGIFAMLGGNGDQTSDNGNDALDIIVNDNTLWESENGEFGQYRMGDFNMDGDVEFNDRLLWEPNNGMFTSVLR